MIVTDKHFYMDAYLVENLMGITQHLKEGWDCVIIVSGHSKVRIGKSTRAAQIGYVIAWMLAGGRFEIYYEEREDGKKFKKIRELCPNKVPVKFDLNHVAFIPDDLVSKAAKLPKHSVVQYDEGRKGLDSRRVMHSINEMMEDFFQECGQYGHVLIIVLPNFFKLHEDYAVDRSLFLIDCYAVPTGHKMARGYFRFYNEKRKELLYHTGKKKIGTESRYSSVDANFWGRFTKFFPFDKDEYERMKKEALARLHKKKESRADRRLKAQRDAMFYILNKDCSKNQQFIADRLSELTKSEISHDTVRMGVQRVEDYWIKHSTFADEESEK
jgi:hypothetical protein